MEVIMVPYFRRFVHFAVVVSLIGSLLAAGCNDATPSSGPPVANAPGSDGYLFCFWNVENLFDDQENDRLQNADREYDQWFARDHAALELKLSRLSEALIGLNGGRGPDIIALAEVESQRAAELLRDALNSRLTDPAL